MLYYTKLLKRHWLLLLGNIVGGNHAHVHRIDGGCRGLWVYVASNGSRASGTSDASGIREPAGAIGLAILGVSVAAGRRCCTEKSCLIE
jgi:hypothetical protein